MSQVQPVALEKSTDQILTIQWSDDVKQILRFRTIRDACPCATCMEKKMGEQKLEKGELRVLSAAETMPLEILTMRPVGNYAYNIHFSDGHTSGIFTFDLLRQLAD